MDAPLLLLGAEPTHALEEIVTDLDVLLEMAGKHGYLWYMFRTDRHGPEVLAGVRRHDGCADVFVLLDAGHARAYRMPTGPDDDVFAPTLVFWWYGASPVWTLRALLTLSPPDDRGTLVLAPPGLGVPGERTPVRVRLRQGTTTVPGGSPPPQRGPAGGARAGPDGGTDRG